MSEYVAESMMKGAQLGNKSAKVLTKAGEKATPHRELRHGEWIMHARRRLKHRRFSSPLFALLAVFVLLFAGSMYLFEHMDVTSAPIYASKLTFSTLFAISLGFILSVWWSSFAKYNEKIREAERIDCEYRELLLSFSDSLFDIINALNTLAAKPQKSFIVATEFLLGEYVHLLQSQLQRYGDHVAGLGFDATNFLDEKIRIFEGIRERASLSVRGMPKELETLFIGSLNLDLDKLTDSAAKRQVSLRDKLNKLETAAAQQEQAQTAQGQAESGQTEPGQPEQAQH